MITTTFNVHYYQKMAMLVVLLRFLLWSTSCSTVSGFATVTSRSATLRKIPSPRTIWSHHRHHRRNHHRHNTILLNSVPLSSGGRDGRYEEDNENDDKDLWTLVAEANGQTAEENGKDFFFAKSERNGSSNNNDDSSNNNQSDDNSDEKELKISRSKQLHFRLDGLEPYVLVSAITSTASFEALTQGNAFADNNFVFGMDNILPSILLISCTASSVLGLYALGIFSLSILYSKAALGSQESTKIYKEFFDKTAKYRYKAFVNFLRSLALFVVDIFLFALTYFPDNLKPVAGIVGALVTYWCCQDWSGIVDAANPIFNQVNEHDEDEEDDN